MRITELEILGGGRKGGMVSPFSCSDLEICLEVDAVNMHRGQRTVRLYIDIRTGCRSLKETEREKLPMKQRFSSWKLRQVIPIWLVSGFNLFLNG